MRKLLIAFAVALALCLPVSVNVFAAEGTGSPSNVNITVVMPDVSSTPAPSPTPDPVPAAPVIPSLYPSNIEETENNGERLIVKTYELGADENPKDIPRDSFTRDGWQYDLSDITKSETSDTDKQDHVETVKVNTSTNDTNAILQQLDPTMEYKSEDGYVGTLTLDIASIKVEQAGTQTSSYTVSATREYPNLSNEDTSFVPKTITDGGRTMKLAGVEWRAQTIDGIDGEQIPSSYTAVAKYTGTGSKTVITGYVTTADYKGPVSKTSAGKMVYKAIFIGTEIPPEPATLLEMTQPSDLSAAQQPSGDESCHGRSSSSAAVPAPENTTAAAVTATTSPQDSASAGPTVTVTQEPTAAAMATMDPSQSPEATAGPVQGDNKQQSIWPSVFSIFVAMLLLNCVVYYFLLRKRPAVKPEAPPDDKHITPVDDKSASPVDAVHDAEPDEADESAAAKDEGPKE